MEKSSLHTTSCLIYHLDNKLLYFRVITYDSLARSLALLVLKMEQGL